MFTFYKEKNGLDLLKWAVNGYHIPDMDFTEMSLAVLTYVNMH